MTQNLRPNEQAAHTAIVQSLEATNGHQNNQLSVSEEIWPGKMRVFISGRGKAEKDMGIAPLPPVWNAGKHTWFN